VARILRVLAACGVACAAFAATVGSAPKPLVIGVSISKTGSNADTAAYVLQGYQLWVAQANATGGLLGRRVRLKVYNDATDGPTAAAMYQKLLGQDHVDLLAGPYGSALTKAVIPVVEAAKRVMVGQTAGTALYAGTRWNVEGYTQGSRYFTGLGDALVFNGVRTLALLWNVTPGTAEICDGMRARAQAQGIQIVYDRSFPATTTDFGPFVTSLKAAGAGAVVACTFLPDSIAVRRELLKQGVSPRLLALTIGPVDPAFRTALGNDAEGVVSPTLWWPTLKTPGNAAFVKAFRKAFHRPPIYQAAAAYASLQALSTAVRAAGSLNQAKIRRALGAREIPTVFGRFRVDGDGRQLGNATYLMQWQDGRQVLVWPSSLAQAQMRFSP
jgi:branched-chain amino acid transport system substrate-binding protein